MFLVMAVFLLSGCGSESGSPPDTGGNTEGGNGVNDIAYQVSNALTMSGNDTATIGTRFPVTGAGSENSTITVNADSCAIQPANVCAFMGVLTLTLTDTGEFHSANLMWVQDNSLSFNYYLNCWPVACGNAVGVSIDAAAKTITFDQVEFVAGLYGVGAGGDQTGPLTLDGTITLSGVTFP